jgi:hypothetical protein
MIRRNEQRPTVSATVPAGIVATDYNTKHGRMMLQHAASATIEAATLASFFNGVLVF